MKRIFSTFALGCLTLGFAHAIVHSHNYFATYGGPSGLYNGAGTQTTSAVSLLGAKYELTYDVTHSTPGIFPFSYYFSSVSGVWTTTIRVKFNNSNWQTAPADSKVWVQVCNFLSTYNASTNTVTVGAPNSYFQAPQDTVLTVTPSQRYSANLDFVDVSPKAFDISSLNVDPTDPTGNTGFLTWNQVFANQEPWDLLPPDPTTATKYADGSGTTFFGVVWVFGKPDADGWTSLSSRGITTAYGIPAEELEASVVPSVEQVLYANSNLPSVDTPLGRLLRR